MKPEIPKLNIKLICLDFPLKDLNFLCVTIAMDNSKRLKYDYESNILFWRCISQLLQKEPKKYIKVRNARWMGNWVFNLEVLVSHFAPLAEKSIS